MSQPGARVPKRATYADIEALPEHLVGEILDGDLYASPRPRLRHAVAGTRLAGELTPPFDFGRGGPGGWWLLAEPELHLGNGGDEGDEGDEIVVPDLAGWRRERLPVVPDEPFLELAPDWVCEILSPSTERIDRGLKLGVYARAHVSHAWLVNPTTQTLEILRLEVDKWLVAAVHTGEAMVRAEPFEAIELALGGLWGSSPQ